MPLTSISALGWQQAWLETQRDGLTSHLADAGWPFDTELWASEALNHRSGTSAWWPFEQTAYWIDGMYRCGILLADDPLTSRAETQFRYVLDRAHPEDGYLGPLACRKGLATGRWPHTIFFRALMAYADAGHAEEVVAALRRHYLEGDYDHGAHRDVANIEAMLWTWERCGDPALLGLAERTWKDFVATAEDHDQELTPERLRQDAPAHVHGVTFCEVVKQPALLYAATGKAEYLTAAEHGFKKLEKHHLLATGAPSSTETLRGTTGRDACETCDIADFIWACGALLAITGNGHYADLAERAGYNAHPGAVNKDFSALQYFSAPNQLMCTHDSCHCLTFTGGSALSYRLMPGTECCTGQAPRVFPALLSRQFLARQGEPVIALYAPARHGTVVAGTPVEVAIEGNYPFADQVAIRVRCAETVSFSLWLRVPAWSKTITVLVGGHPVELGRVELGFAPLQRTWSEDTVVEVRFAPEITTRRWPEDGISVERGPLVFALPVTELAEVDQEDPRQSARFPSVDLRPSGLWNVGLDPAHLHAVLHAPTAPVQHAWQHPSMTLEVDAKTIPGWTIEHAHALPSLGGELVDPVRNRWRDVAFTKEGDFHLTPALPAADLRRDAVATRRVMLVPVGNTRLRITVFPALSSS